MCEFKFAKRKMKSIWIATIFLLINLIKLSKAIDCLKDQILINGECKNLVNFHNKCISTKMCRTKNAICLDENNKEHNFNPNQLDIEREAYCQCPFRYEFSPQKDECLYFRKLCYDNSTCETNYFCSHGQCRCLFEDNRDKYYTHCLHQEVNVVTCFKDPVRTICTNHTQRYDVLPDSFMMINQTWSAMLWKMSFLTLFLILLMLLIKGVLRARQNEDYMNWARTIQLQRDAIRYNDNVNRSNRDISVTVQADSPPSYSDAIKAIQNDRHTTQTSI